MKAVQLEKYGEIQDSISITDKPEPKVGSNDILIAVKASAINPIDKSIVLGNLQAMLPISLPVTLAYDVSGVVSEVGDEVSSLSVGDRVYARVPQEQMGTLAEYVAVNEQAVAKKPGNISFEEAAGIPLAGLTAMQSLESVGLKANDKVLIHAGSGGVGSLAIQYAKAKGAYVYTTTSTKNLDWVKELGADEVIDYKNQDYKNVVENADIVFDTLGQEYTSEAFQVIKPGGKVVSVAGPLDEKSASMFGMNDYSLPKDLADLSKQKQAEYSFIFMHPNGEHLTTLKDMIEDEKIKPIIDEVYSLDKSKEAFEHLATGRAKGKVIIKVS